METNIAYCEYIKIIKKCQGICYNLTMYKPHQKPVTRAFADVKVSEPKISKFFIFIISLLSKVYLFMLFGSAKILLRGDTILFDAFKRALSKKSRCMIAFRHPDGREPQLLAWFIIFRLNKLAKKSKVKFARKPHAIFIYGYEVARWGGAVARLFMPNIGAIPIHHTKLDSKGMGRIYSALQEGPYPIALAPEGQVSYSVDTLPRLESGAVRIGFQAASQLEKLSAKSCEQEKVNCPLEILPLSIHFWYGKNGERAMNRLLKKIEKFCGFKYDKNLLHSTLTQRFKRCREYILGINETRYGIKSDTSRSFEERLKIVVYAALETAEKMLGIKNEGDIEADFFPRLYRVRHDCWDNIFLPNEDNLDKVSDVKRNVMDLKAGEVWHIARHQELADFGWYFTHTVPVQDSPLHLMVEYVQNLWDFLNRTMGGAISGRINIPPCKVIIKAAPVINLTERLPQYKEDKRSACDDAKKELEQRYLDCIREINQELSGTPGEASLEVNKLK
jgi:hypothetical protein